MGTFRQALGQELRQRRRSQGRSLAHVADAAHISFAYLSEIERGQKEASSEVLDAICGALDVAIVVRLRVRGQAETGTEFIPHGTTNGYKNYRCRCEKCRESHRVYYREWRRKRQQRARESAA